MKPLSRNPGSAPAYEQENNILQSPPRRRRRRRCWFKHILFVYFVHRTTYKYIQ